MNNSPSDVQCVRASRKVEKVVCACSHPPLSSSAVSSHITNMRKRECTSIAFSVLVSVTGTEGPIAVIVGCTVGGNPAVVMPIIPGGIIVGPLIAPMRVGSALDWGPVFGGVILVVERGEIDVVVVVVAVVGIEFGPIGICIGPYGVL